MNTKSVNVNRHSVNVDIKECEYEHKKRELSQKTVNVNEIILLQINNHTRKHFVIR